MIYLDNAATGKPFKAVVNLVCGFYEDFYNPSAAYTVSNNLKKEIDLSRKKIADELNASANEIYFTSGATESNNWAVLCGYKNKKGTLVTTVGEHASVYEPAMSLKSAGVDVIFLPLKSDGAVNEEEFEKSITQNTAFVSVIHVNNETGAVNDIERLCYIAKQKNKNIVFHSDGVQSFLKNKIDLKKSGIDLYSISGHKIGSSKGIGALYIKNDFVIKPLIFGGGQERSARSGTENTLGIRTFCEAINEFKKIYDKDFIATQSDYIKNTLKNSLSGVIINSTEKSIPDIISVSFSKIKSEILIRLLSDNEIYVGAGSACSTKQKKSRVLNAMDIPPQYHDGNIRISIPPDITEYEIKTAVDAIIKHVNFLR